MEKKSYLAIDIGGTDIKWAEITHDYHMISHGKCENHCTDSAMLIHIIEDTAVSHPSIQGIGISVPGTVKMSDPDGTVIGGGALTFMDKVPLGKLIREHCALPCSVANDGKCCVLGEYEAGVLKGCSSGVVLALGTGVGGGIIINGQILEGFHSFAGEFSFLKVNMQGAFSMENAIGGACSWLKLKHDILTEMNLQDDPKINGYKLFEWIEEGNAAAVRGLHQYARSVAELILQLEAVVDPEVFVIAGGISSRAVLIEAIQEETQKILDSIPYKQLPLPRIKGAALGNDADLYGAAMHLRNMEQHLNQ